MQKRLSFSGYHNRPPQADDPLLTQVGPDTPGGEYLRRYWHPFMLASELGNLPVAVRKPGRLPRQVRAARAPASHPSS